MPKMKFLCQDIHKLQPKRTDRQTHSVNMLPSVKMGGNKWHATPHVVIFYGSFCNISAELNSNNDLHQIEYSHDIILLIYNL